MVQLLPIIIISGFWLFVGFICPIFVPNGPNKGIIRVMLMLTAVCCYVLWLTTFVAQLNPLFGPQLNVKMLSLMYKWKF